MPIGLVIVLLGAAALIGYVVGRRGTDDVDRLALEARADSNESDDRVMHAIETLPLGLVLYDRSGREVFHNSTALRLGGNRHQRPLVDVALEEVSRSAAFKGSYERSLDLFGPPRQVLDFRGSEVVVEDASIGVVVIIEDVTEQRRAVEIRRDFVANVSHELKTPVGAMGILAEALVDADDPEVVDRLGGRLLAEAIRLGNTIDDLLALSAIESGTIPEPHLVDPGDVVADAIARSAAAAEVRSITISVQNEAGSARVLGDRRQLVTAIGNLIDNAVKYSDAGSEVVVRVWATVPLADTGANGAPPVEAVDEAVGQLTFEVADSGIGIPSSDRERIFERFYRVDQARSRTTGGTGLGLSIVRHVAVNHEGKVDIESVEGEGSTFRLQLPLALEATVERPPTSNVSGGT